MKKLPIAILLIILIRTFFVINQGKEEVMVEEPEVMIEESEATESAAMETDMVYSMEEVAKHTTPEDCWLVLDDAVFDVSNFAKHPGEDAIYEGCGLDATHFFETRPMGSGTAHSEEARTWTKDFEIGMVAQ